MRSTDLLSISTAFANIPHRTLAIRLHPSTTRTQRASVQPHSDYAPIPCAALTSSSTASRSNPLHAIIGRFVGLSAARNTALHIKYHSASQGNRRGRWGEEWTVRGTCAVSGCNGPGLALQKRAAHEPKKGLISEVLRKLLNGQQQCRSNNAARVLLCAVWGVRG